MLLFAPMGTSPERVTSLSSERGTEEMRTLQRTLRAPHAKRSCGGTGAARPPPTAPSPRAHTASRRPRGSGPELPQAEPPRPVPAASRSELRRAARSAPGLLVRSSRLPRGGGREGSGEGGRGESGRCRRCSRHRGNKGGGNKERQVAPRSAAGQGAAARTKARPGRAAPNFWPGGSRRGALTAGAVRTSAAAAAAAATSAGGGSERGREEGPAPAAPRPGRCERAPRPRAARRRGRSPHGTARPAPRLRLPPRGCPRRRLGAAPGCFRSLSGAPGRNAAVFPSAPRTDPRRATFPPRVPSRAAAAGIARAVPRGEWDRLCGHTNFKGFQNFGGGWAAFLSFFLSSNKIGRNSFYLFLSVLCSFWLWILQC